MVFKSAPPRSRYRICNVPVMLLTALDFYIKASDAVVASRVPRNTPRDTANHFEGIFIMSIRKSVIALSLV
ncbi:MAG: hypothetical protein Q7U28_15055, partial [Aquabacterium sp.]|nr:hypothetical protein [Aquabacterium sp.]